MILTFLKDHWGALLTASIMIGGYAYAIKTAKPDPRELPPSHNEGIMDDVMKKEFFKEHQN